MKNLLATVAVVGLLAGCSAQQQQQAATVVTGVCTDVAKIPATVTAVLDAQDQHSALGVLWADMKSGCQSGTITAGVSTDWVGVIWGELKVLIPQVIPAVLPYLIGLL